MDKGRYNISRKEAEAIVNNHTFCLIHNRPMVEYGEPDLCGTYATKCPQCEKEGQLALDLKPEQELEFPEKGNKQETSVHVEDLRKLLSPEEYALLLHQNELLLDEEVWRARAHVNLIAAQPCWKQGRPVPGQGDDDIFARHIF